MRKLVFVFGFLSAILMLKAQQANNEVLLSGEVVYQEIVKLDIQLEGVDEHIAAQIPKEQKS